ncbi:hypothetical protein [Marinoscillum sp. MHG1-6]|uniref:hypothetical protein n=1 Tax=Marinoscillum sp. MHG1-6 TaxID=2959627 RepID=UPI0021570394|nr:hypothetical protein [Marinoscillum sp. MHG1-6]
MRICFKGNHLGGLLVLTTLLLSHCFVAQAGGGWTYDKGKGFFKIGQNAIFGNAYFNSNGDVVDLTRSINLYTSSLYMEYGVSDRLNVILYAPFFVRSTFASAQFVQSGIVLEGDEMNAIGDINLGMKFGIIKSGPIVLSGSITFGLPLGETSGGNTGLLMSGDGEFNQLFKLDASHSFYPVPFYVSALVGINNRTRDFSEEFHAGLEAGYTIGSLTAIMKLYNISSFYNGDASPSAGNGVFSNNTEYFSYTPELNYSFANSLGISISAGFAFSGKRILASPNWALGIFYEL